MIKPITVAECESNIMPQEVYDLEVLKEFESTADVHIEHLNEELKKKIWRPIDSWMSYDGYTKDFMRHYRIDQDTAQRIILLYREAGWDCWWNKSSQSIAFWHPKKKRNWFERVFF